TVPAGAAAALTCDPHEPQNVAPGAKAAPHFAQLAIGLSPFEVNPQTSPTATVASLSSTGRENRNRASYYAIPQSPPPFKLSVNLSETLERPTPERLACPARPST